jgi:V8-like Glu-specific endopeptidase
MRKLLLLPLAGCAGVGLLGAALMSQASAQEPVVAGALEQAAANYWNAGRLMRATPLDVPAVAQTMEELLAAPADDAWSAAGDDVMAAGAYAVEDEAIAPDLEARLHPPFKGPREELPEVTGLDLEEAAADVVAPADVGSSGAYFSSSRLVPTDARLSYPYSTVGKLFFTQPGVGNFVCSAAVLRPRIVLTAGHCVHQGSGGNAGFFSNFLFVPAFHQGQAPYRQWSWAFAVTTGSWSVSNGTVPNRADFGILVVGDQPYNGVPTRIGNVTGWLGYRTNALLPNHVKMVGYPVNFDSGQITHQVDAQHSGFAGQGTVVYGSDMRGGSSGGPWVENFGTSAVGQTGGLRFFPNRVVGVTSYGPVSEAPKYQGSSVLNQEFLDILTIACNQAPGNC